MWNFINFMNCCHWQTLNCLSLLVKSALNARQLVVCYLVKSVSSKVCLTCQHLVAGWTHFQLIQHLHSISGPFSSSWTKSNRFRLLLWHRFRKSPDSHKNLLSFVSFLITFNVKLGEMLQLTNAWLFRSSCKFGKMLYMEVFLSLCKKKILSVRPSDGCVHLHVDMYLFRCFMRSWFSIC